MAKKQTLKEMIRNGFPEGFPFPAELEMLCDWVDQNGSPISGYFRMFADEGKDAITYWMGFDNANKHLGVFGSTPDGSMYALWNDGSDSSYKVVHLGSEGDNLLVLSHNFVDFLRLLAIGYDEIGNCDLTITPQENDGYDEDMENPRFAAWVSTTFNVTIPRTGDEIVNIYDKSFDNWVDDQQSEYSRR
jgi:hypothetical protein